MKNSISYAEQNDLVASALRRCRQRKFGHARFRAIHQIYIILLWKL